MSSKAALRECKCNALGGGPTSIKQPTWRKGHPFQALLNDWRQHAPLISYSLMIATRQHKGHVQTPTDIPIPPSGVVLLDAAVSLSISLTGDASLIKVPVEIGVVMTYTKDKKQIRKYAFPNVILWGPHGSHWTDQAGLMKLEMETVSGLEGLYRVKQMHIHLHAHNVLKKLGVYKPPSISGGPKVQGTEGLTDYSLFITLREDMATKVNEEGKPDIKVLYRCGLLDQRISHTLSPYDNTVTFEVPTLKDHLILRDLGLISHGDSTEVVDTLGSGEANFGDPHAYKYYFCSKSLLPCTITGAITTPTTSPLSSPATATVIEGSSVPMTFIDDLSLVVDVILYDGRCRVLWSRSGYLWITRHPSCSRFFDAQLLSDEGLWAIFSCETRGREDEKRIKPTNGLLSKRRKIETEDKGKELVDETEGEVTVLRAAKFIVPLARINRWFNAHYKLQEVTFALIDFDKQESRLRRVLRKE